jgi:hypothetical protein
MKRFVLLIIAVTALAVGSVPSPAAASVPGRVLVSGSTGSTSDAKAAYVDCPGDTWLLGSGVDVSGTGRRFVIIRYLIPTLRSVAAYADEWEYGTTDTWSLRVWAVCGDQVGTHRTVSVESAVNSTNKGVTAICPDDTVVTGTGWEIEGGSGQVLIESAVPSTDHVTVNAYEVFAGADLGYSGVWSVRAYATCVTRPSGHSIVAEMSESTSVEKNGNSDCVGKVTLGGGFFLIGPRGWINNISLIPTSPAVQTYATEVASTSSNWPIWSYAVCAYP